MASIQKGPAESEAGEALDGAHPNNASGAKGQWHWREFQRLMLVDLAEILKCESADLPPVFTADHPMALKVGIDADIIALFPDVNALALSRWLKWWTPRPEYLRLLVEGVARYDLFGDREGEIDAAQAGHARKLRGAKVKATTPDPQKLAAAARRPILKLNFSDDDGDTGSGKPKRRINRGYDKANDTLKKNRQGDRATDSIIKNHTEQGYIDRVIARARR